MQNLQQNQGAATPRQTHSPRWRAWMGLLLLFFCLTASAQFSKPRRQYVEWLVTTNHADRNYRTGEQATLTVEALKGGAPLNGVTLYYRAGDDMLLPAEEDSVRFSDGRAVIPMGTRAQPGFRACSLRFSVGGRQYKDLVKVGFSPEQIRPFTTMPADFDKFWQEALKEAAATDLKPEITPLPERSTDKVEVSLVKLTVGPGGRNMYGYLTRPRDGQKHPVLFCPPGAGASKIGQTNYYSERGYIYLNICIHSGCNPELGDSLYAKARRVADGYERSGIADKDSFYYRSVYAGCARCVDFLCSLPDWDGRNVGVTGGSQGGALTIVTTALSPRVTFCAPFYPALCDLTAFSRGRAGGWPFYWRKGNETPGAEQTLQYYDVVNFARRLKCPVFFSFGYNDDTCPPTTTYGTYNEIKAPKRLAVTPSSGHWRFAETNEEAMEWMKSLLKP